MAALEDYRALVEALHKEWNEAEGAIKQAEQIAKKIVYPSINELRYAGRRITEALNQCLANGDPAKIAALFRDAHFDCLRARHDAIEAATAKIAADMDIMREKLGYEPILAAFPRFADLTRAISAVRQKIVESRKDRENREKIYAVIQATDLTKLIAEYESLLSAEPIMIMLAKKQRLLKLVAYSALAVAVLDFLSRIFNISLSDLILFFRSLL